MFSQGEGGGMSRRWEGDGVQKRRKERWTDDNRKDESGTNCTSAYGLWTVRLTVKCQENPSPF